MFHVKLPPAVSSRLVSIRSFASCFANTSMRLHATDDMACVCIAWITHIVAPIGVRLLSPRQFHCHFTRVYLASSQGSADILCHACICMKAEREWMTRSATLAFGCAVGVVGSPVGTARCSKSRQAHVRSTPPAFATLRGRLWRGNCGCRGSSTSPGISLFHRKHRLRLCTFSCAPCRDAVAWNCGGPVVDGSVCRSCPCRLRRYPHPDSVRCTSAIG